MKVSSTISLLLASLLLAACFQATPQVSGTSCVTLYTRGAAGSYGAYKFTGITNGTDMADYNNPGWYSKSKALALSGTPDVRLVGELSLKTNLGNLNFEFFKSKSWISVIFGKGPDKVANVVVGGTGCFAGYAGTATRTVLAGYKPAAFQWTICTQAAKSCPAGSA